MGTPAPALKWRHARFDYQDANSIEEACSLLAQHQGKAKIIAGGTDFLIAARRGIPVPSLVINLKSVSGLDYIRHDKNNLSIGALATMNAITNSPVIKELFPVIGDAASKLGTPQVRNVATIGGNICNAAPSADIVPSLIGFRAAVIITGLKGKREIPLEGFFTGPGKTVLQNDEILTEVRVPNPPTDTRGVYLKLPADTAIGIAVVGVAVILTLDKSNTVADAIIVLGAVAPTPLRAVKAEHLIKEQAFTYELIDRVAQAAADESRPISDVRGSAGYRKEMVRVLTAQAIRQAIRG